jgi:ArsR family transcriptional regulator, arsenate/arsenite/antimonite-responsive transcriptional repressor
MPKRQLSSDPKYREKIVAAMKALSNENRLAIFEHIRAGHNRGTVDINNQLTMCEVADKIKIALSTISHHVKELRNADLITCGRQGQTVRCVVNEETVGLMVQYLTGKK